MGTAHGALIRWCLRRQHHQEAAMGRYSHLTIEERGGRHVPAQAGGRASPRSPARSTGTSPTVSRELARNSCAASTARPWYRASNRPAALRGAQGGVPQAAAARRPREARARQGARARGALVARAAGGAHPPRAPRPRRQRHDDLPRDRLRPRSTAAWAAEGRRRG